MDLPPSRYRVEERGRRLIVIDTKSGAPVSRQAEPRRASNARPVDAPRPEPRPARSAGRPAAGNDLTILTTQPWFDDKAPRRVRVGERGQKGFAGVVVAVLIGALSLFALLGWPALVIGAVLLSQKPVLGAFRRQMTRWLDGLEQVGPAS